MPGALRSKLSKASRTLSRPIGKHRGIVVDASWIAIGSLLNAIIQLAGTRAVTQFVPPDVFGASALLLAILTLQKQLFLYPMGQAIYRHCADVARVGRIPLLRRISDTLIFKITAVTSILSLAGAVLSRSYTGVTVATLLLLLGLYVSDALRLTQTQVLLATRRQRAFAMISVLEVFLRPIGIIVFVYCFSATTTHYLGGYLVALLPIVFLTLRTIGAQEGHEPVGIDDHADGLRLERDLLRYALPLAPMALVSWVSNLSDRLLIGKLLGAWEVGSYSAVYALGSQPVMMTHALLAYSLMPPYHAAVVAQDKRREERIFQVRLLLSVLLCAIAVFGAVLFKNLIARFFLGPAYRDAAPLIPWIAFGYSFQVLTYVYQGIFIAHKRSGLILLTESIGALACLPIQIFFIWKYGLRGAAMAVAAYLGVQFAATVIIVKIARRRGRLGVPATVNEVPKRDD